MAYGIVDGALQVKLRDGSNATLANAEQLRGYTGSAQEPSGILLSKTACT